jgi:hypothetical protein
MAHHRSRQTNLEPYFSIAFSNLSSSSGLQFPFAVSALPSFENHRLRQSLLFRPGICLAMACHFEGFNVLVGSSEEQGSELLACRGEAYLPLATASRRSSSSSVVHERRSR